MKFNIPNPLEYLNSESEGETLSSEVEKNVSRLVYLGGLAATLACGLIFGNPEKHSGNPETAHANTVSQQKLEHLKQSVPKSTQQ
jgi:hypothetical protein